ncbi:zinc finger MYM-type 1-like [Brachionus plicatilis]|uniref:Zinc finger MYM-type 1-like n=1 Tax=Brachionus plicatilis TaxID=10195 RepID=A0A3M7PL47_BRAPC|nr:zinc finger MYM-type 1-like [Brachionus plicatilis]
MSTTKHFMSIAMHINTCSRTTEVRNCIGTVNSTYNLVEGSAKRHHIFKELQNENGESNLTIKKLSDTRWSSRDKAFKSIRDNLPIIFEALKEIDENDRNQTGCTANSLLKSIRTFDFYFYIITLSELFDCINVLSVYLQKPDLDLKTARQMCKTLIENIENSIKQSNLWFIASVNQTIQELSERFSDELKPLFFIYELLFDDVKIVDFEYLVSEVKVWQSIFINSFTVQYNDALSKLITANHSILTDPERILFLYLRYPPSLSHSHAVKI